MDDKRKMANDELSETINSGVLSFTTPEVSPFTDLPEMPQLESQSESGNISNNFNINVNVSGNANPSRISNAATSTMRNILPNLTGSPDDIKKNSSVIFQDTSNPILDDAEIYQDGSSVPILDFVKFGVFDLPEISNYTYTESYLKEVSNKEVKNYEILKNVVHNSVTQQNDISNVSPYSAFDTSLYVEETMGQRHLQTINNLNIHQNSENNLELANEMSRQQKHYQSREEDLVEQAKNNFGNVNQMNALGEEDKREAATSTNMQFGAGPITSNQSPSRKASNINGPLFENPLFVKQMNSPPVWRTVLG